MLLVVGALYAELESYYPINGVKYRVDYLSTENGNVYFRFYGSQQVNCNRENKTDDPELGFQVANHSGLRYNELRKVDRVEYKSPSMGSWGLIGGVTQSEFSYDWNYPVSNLNNLKGNNNYIMIRFRIQIVSANCANEEHTYNGHTYWMHNRTVIPDGAIGGDGEVTYDYQYYIYDGEIKEFPTITIQNVTGDYYNEGEPRLNGYVKVTVMGISSSELNSMSRDDLQIQWDMVESNASVQSPGLTVLGLDDFEDVNGKAETISIYERQDNDYNKDNYFRYTVGVIMVWNGVNISSNMETVTLGDVLQSDRTTDYFIRYSVTESGTINAVVVNRMKLISGSVHLVMASDARTQWSCLDTEQVGSHFVYNPYKGDSSRDVPRIVHLAATLFKGTGDDQTWTNVNTSIIMPPLGEEKNNDTDGENIDDLPEDEDENRQTESFTPSDDLTQTNEILNDLLNEFKNGRDENLEFMKDFLEWSEIGNINTNYTPSDPPTAEEGGSLSESLGDQLGEAFGNGLSYGDDLGSGFGNGLGSSMDFLKSVTDHDMVLTLDFRNAHNIIPFVDTSSWLVSVHLLPDTTTEFGSGVENIVKNYVRPIILYALYVVLGYVCMKDVTKFFST